MLQITLRIVKRTFTILASLSAIGFCFLLIIWPVSYYLDLSRSIGSGKPTPSDSIPITPHYRLGFEGGSMWLYTHAMPYQGSIMWISGTNDPPPVVRAWNLGPYGFAHIVRSVRSGKMSESTCDLPGIYFRRFWDFDANPAWTTLRMSLGYPLLLLAILPALWLYRRRRLCLRKS